MPHLSIMWFFTNYNIIILKKISKKLICLDATWFDELFRSSWTYIPSGRVLLHPVYNQTPHFKWRLTVRVVEGTTMVVTNMMWCQCMEIWSHKAWILRGWAPNGERSLNRNLPYLTPNCNLSGSNSSLNAMKPPQEDTLALQLFFISILLQHIYFLSFSLACSFLSSLHQQ